MNLTREEIYRRDAARENAGVPYVGIPTDEPCDICGAKKHNQTESRFCYTVCADHAALTPVEVGEKKYERSAGSPGRD